jgi:hypothetical protein
MTLWSTLHQESSKCQVLKLDVLHLPVFLLGQDVVMLVFLEAFHGVLFFFFSVPFFPLEMIRQWLYVVTTLAGHPSAAKTARLCLYFMVKD